MSTNKAFHITYIGRLESEKGIAIVLDCIKRGYLENRNIVWHICGDGLFFDKFKELEKYEKLDIYMYGHVDRDKIDEILSISDLVLMPSLFLETFGLVALETLMRGVPVCGFAQGGLIDFIHPSLALDRDNSVDSFFAILDMRYFPVLDVTSFGRDIWMERLRIMTDGVERILLVNDYISSIGGAEQYIYDLADSLRAIGKEVEIFGYTKKVSRYMRIWLMILSPFAFWRGISLSKKVYQSKPDLIWIHSILRYIGPHGLKAIRCSKSQKLMTHHDLGLIAPRPSQVYIQSDIPLSPNLGDWIPKRIDIFSILTVTIKWLYISWIWHILEKSHIQHILPSEWMEIHFQKYIQHKPLIFPHTSRTPVSVKL